MRYSPLVLPADLWKVAPYALFAGKLPRSAENLRQERVALITLLLKQVEE